VPNADESPSKLMLIQRNVSQGRESASKVRPRKANSIGRFEADHVAD